MADVNQNYNIMHQEIYDTYHTLKKRGAININIKFQNG